MDGYEPCIAPQLDSTTHRPEYPEVIGRVQPESPHDGSSLAVAALSTGLSGARLAVNLLNWGGWSADEDEARLRPNSEFMRWRVVAHNSLPPRRRGSQFIAMLAFDGGHFAAGRSAAKRLRKTSAAFHQPRRMARSSYNGFHPPGVLFPVEQLDLKEQGCVRGDFGRVTASAVTKVSGDNQLALPADLHCGDAFIPT